MNDLSVVFVLVLARDLLDRTRLVDQLTASGCTVKAVRTFEALRADVVDGAIVVVDLDLDLDLDLDHDAAADPSADGEPDRGLAWLGGLAARAVRVVGYASHVERDRIARARQHGIEVHPRSKLFAAVGSLVVPGLAPH